MTTWQWSVIKALIRVVLSILANSMVNVPISAKDAYLLNDALKRKE